MSTPERQAASIVMADDVTDYQKFRKEKFGEVVAYGGVQQWLHKLILQMYHLHRPIIEL